MALGSGGLAVDALAIGCLGVERRGERFFVLSLLGPAATWGGVGGGGSWPNATTTFPSPPDAASTCTVGRLVVHCPVAPRICFENLLHPPCNGRVTHCPLLSNELRPDSLPNVVSRALVDPLPEHAWYGTVHNLVKQILQVSCSPPPTSCAPGWQLQPCSDGTESQSSLRVRAWLP